MSEVIAQFNLNEEQISVLRKLLSVIRFPEDPGNCPIVLVHGVFGSGKSTLVCIKLQSFISKRKSTV